MDDPDLTKWDLWTIIAVLGEQKHHKYWDTRVHDVRARLQAGADANAGRFAPLTLASSMGSEDFTSVLKQAGVQISMDGKGRWMDNVFIERLWRSLKYECVYLHAFQDGLQARQAIDTWVRYYNEERPHSTFAGARTPMEEYSRLRRAA